MTALGVPVMDSVASRPAMDEERPQLSKQPSGGKAVVRDYASRTKIGRARGRYSGKGPEYRRGSGQQRNQGQDEAEHQRGEETRSSIKMVDQNNGSVKVVSLSDIFSSSGALPFSEEFRVYISQKRQADQESPQGAAPGEQRTRPLHHPPPTAPHTCVISSMPPRPAKPNDYVDLRRRSMARSRAASPPGASRAGNLRCAGAAVGPSSEGIHCEVC